MFDALSSSNSIRDSCSMTSKSLSGPRPTVSVVMPAYNAAATIAGALESISRQDLAVDEVVVIDDGSSDATLEIAESWRDRLPLNIIQNEKNAGICISLQRGVAASRSDWVFRIDADDRWLPCHTSSLMQFCADERTVVVSSRATYFDADGNRLFLTKEISDRNVRARLMWDNPLVHSATGFRKSAYEKAGGYGPSNECQDYFLWSRLLELGQLGYAPEPSVEYVVFPNSLSRRPMGMALASRWDSQLDAISRFWRRHPLDALGCCAIGGARIAIYKLGLLV
jgi:glycosyltransferase involved in cell wall biosynthesis